MSADARPGSSVASREDEERAGRWLAFAVRVAAMPEEPGT